LSINLNSKLKIHQDLVKIEEMPETTITIPARRHGAKWTMKDLPEGAMEDGLWRHAFVPTYIDFVSQQEDPWTINDADAKSAMQKIWKAVYKKRDVESYKIRSDGPVFALVCTAF
jgi:hypothetical protein